MKKILTFCFSIFLILSCKNEETQLMMDFYKLNPETVRFFESNIKLQCKCLEQESEKLNRLFSENESLINDLKSKKRLYSDASVQKKFSTEIYPVLGAYNNCNAEAPQPRPKEFSVIEKDLMKFSGFSEPGEPNDRLRELNNQLLKKYCSEKTFRLSMKLNELSILITSVYNKE